MITLPQLRVVLPFLVLSLLLNVPAICQGGAQNSADANCERLAQLKLPATTITIAKLVPAGTFSGPPAIYSGKDLTPFYKTLPAFCRVVAQATPTSDSDIKIEVWMPATAWNGKLQGIGNGGFAGQIDYGQLGAAVLHGYAATATDTGHSGTPIDATWALGHPEKVIDFGHRGVHEMTRIAKAAINGFYGRNPERSYFWGCSDGGREALMEAQRYPEDYDGILAGAPANYWTALLSSAVWNTQALTTRPSQFHPAGENSFHRECRARGLRLAGWRPRWRAQRSPQVSLRSRIDPLQERRGFRQVPHRASGGSAEEAVPGPAGLARTQRVSWVFAWSRGWSGRLGALDHGPCSKQKPDGVLRLRLFFKYGLRQE